MEESIFKTSEAGPQEALRNSFLTCGILLRPYKEAQASLWRRTDWGE